MAEFKRLKRIRSHVGHARWFREVGGYPTAYIPRVDSIPSPYRYSPVEQVFSWEGKNVIVKETAHKIYDVFEVPHDVLLYKNDKDAEDVYIGSKR